MNFDPSNPSLKDYLLSTEAFTLEQVFGVNGKRRHLTDEIVEAQEAARVSALKNYLDNIHLNHEEVTTLLNEDMSVDDIQKGWLRKGLGKVLEDSSLVPALKSRLTIELIPERENVSIKKGVLDLSEVKNDPLLSYAMDFTKGSFDIRLADIVSKELMTIANIDSDNKQDKSIELLTSATNTSSLGELVGYLEVATSNSMIESQTDERVIRIRKSLETAGMVLRDKIDFVDENELPKIEASLINPDGTSLDSASYGEITENKADKNLTYTPTVDLSLITKQIIESQNIGVHTENAKFDWLRNKANGFGEKVGNSIATEKGNIKKRDSITSRIMSKFKGDSEDEKPEISWESNDYDYDWSDRSEHFSQTNEKKISSVMFTDKKDDHIFTHKPSSFGGGGSILFAKGRLITDTDAKLMVAQFLKTNTSGSMHITPPKHLGGKAHTKRHVSLLLANAVELGLPIDSISVSPNKHLSVADIDEIKQEVGMANQRKDINEFGGLSGEFVGDSVELSLDNPNEMEDVLETKASNTNATPGRT